MSTIRLMDGFSTDIHLFINGIQEANSTAKTVGTFATVLITLPRRDADGTPRRLADLTCDMVAPPLPQPTTSAPAPVRVDFAAGPNDPSNPDSSIIRLTFSVLAHNQLVGETYCRVKYSSPTGQLLSNIIFRLSVHTSLTNFWLGNRRMTLFNDIGKVQVKNNQGTVENRETSIDSSDIVVYATCDDAGTPCLANLTSSSYLNAMYTPKSGASPSAKDVRVTQYKRVIFSTSPTFTSITPVRLGDITVKVGNRSVATTGGAPAAAEVWGVAATTVSRPVLRRFHCGTDQDTTRRLKILFLTEGFKTQVDVDNWLAFVKDQLFNHSMHQPFGILRESIELWTADLLSHDTQPGITQKSPLNAQGYWVPAHPLDYVLLPTQPTMTPLESSTLKNNRSSFFTMRELLKLVGLPSLSSPTTLGSALAAWSPLLTPTTKGTNGLDAVLFEAWQAQKPVNFIYAKDTVFGFAKGTPTLTSSSTTELSWGDWALGDESNVPSIMTWDSGRLGVNQDPQTRLLEILSSLTSGPKVPAADAINGSIWRSDSGNEHAAGLVCILANDPATGGVSFLQGGGYYGSTFSAGGEQRYTITPATPAIPLADIVMTYAPAVPAGAGGATTGPASIIGGIATAVHEIGHLLGLGDEYGNVYGRAHGNTCPLAGDPAVDRFPNIITLDKLQAGTVPLINSKQKLIAPQRMKWNWDRIELAGRLRTNPVLVGTPAANAATVVLRLELDFDPNQNWVAKVPASIVPSAPAPKPVPVILRARKLVDATTGELNATVLYQLMLRSAVAHPAVPATSTTPLIPAYYEVEVEGTLPLVTTGGTVKFTDIKEDDVLYVPRFYPVDKKGRGGQKMSLIANEVAVELGNSSFKVTGPVACATASKELQWPLDAFVQAMNRDLKNQGIANVTSTADTNAPVYAKPSRPPAAPPGPTLHSFNIIAIYEGGGEYDCQAYRSNGYSKMRSASITYLAPVSVTVNPFNYVSKYFLVNKINPTKLAALDAVYATEAY